MQNIESKIRIDRGYVSSALIWPDLASEHLTLKLRRYIEAQIEDAVGDQTHLVSTQLWDYLWDLDIIKFD